MRSCGKKSERSTEIWPTAISKIEANIPVYDAKGEEKNVEELSALLQKMSNRFRFIRWYHLLTEPGKMARKEFRQGEKE